MQAKNIKKLKNTVLIILAGVALGIFSKLLDNMALNDAIYWHRILEFMAGNVRELENIIERACIISLNGLIDINVLPDYIQNYRNEIQIPIKKEISYRNQALTGKKYLSYNDERTLIIETLRKEHGDVTSSSMILGVSKRTLYRKIRKYNININKYRVWD
ncbi:MAG: hypothetical protein GX076_09350 [Clostridiales bacterium]|nr:hypothetical protein [Clostridiales bacterium]